MTEKEYWDMLFKSFVENFNELVNDRYDKEDIEKGLTYDQILNLAEEWTQDCDFEFVPNSNQKLSENFDKLDKWEQEEELGHLYECAANEPKKEYYNKIKKIATTENKVKPKNVTISRLQIKNKADEIGKSKQKEKQVPKSKGIEI